MPTYHSVLLFAIANCHYHYFWRGELLNNEVRKFPTTASNSGMAKDGEFIVYGSTIQFKNARETEHVIYLETRNHRNISSKLR